MQTKLLFEGKRVSAERLFVLQYTRRKKADGTPITTHEDTTSWDHACELFVRALDSGYECRLGIHHRGVEISWMIAVLSSGREVYAHPLEIDARGSLKKKVLLLSEAADFFQFAPWNKYSDAISDHLRRNLEEKSTLGEKIQRLTNYQNEPVL